MESYQHMDSARSGPFRTLQVVSIFIFVIENLTNSPEARDSKNRNGRQQPELTSDALTATFIFMGRLVNRCLKANILCSCPILPALLVFLEWLVCILDDAEIYGSNEKSTSAMSYFFGTFLELLKQFDIMGEVKPPVSVALWEDYELRGFAPLASSHASLDFSTHWGHADSYKCGAEYRAHRIINAAIKIADRSSNNRKWIFYDKSGRNFYAAESNKYPYTKECENAESPSSVVEVNESHQNIQEMTEESDKIEENPSDSQLISKSLAMEEEEVILFKPLTRHNSAPLYSVITTIDQTTPADAVDQIVPADECLRRATSLLIAQNQAQGNASTFHSDLTNFRRNKPLQHQEPLVKDMVAQPFSEASISSGVPTFSTPISSGPPSLNAWVLNRGSLSNDRAKGKRDLNKPSMPPIEEIASTFLNYLSISDAENSAISSRHESATMHNYSPAYSAPLPSAPFLPDDASWLSGNQSTFSDYGSSGNINRTNDSFDVSLMNGYSNWTGSYQPIDYGICIPAFTDGYPPLRGMTSSEWLRQYRENHNRECTPSHGWSALPFAAANTGNFYGHDMSRSGVFDQLGAPLATSPLMYQESPPFYSGYQPAYTAVEHRREKLYHGYQRPSPYGCSGVTEPEPLLQYLKEKEWLLQQDPALRGPTYMGS
ncbi:hypothetical protein JCGZ_21454 [Jatropha curcas]|uniref:DNA/RNA-binding domain-containing protein n=2 Tax=Jatropha curcas TaxID=180498 RepID=A0A067JDZ2_JATCU|nr:hypothetical protein JCGZ_21454 [Jatropha curcas]